jgi:hypothetical protein
MFIIKRKAQLLGFCLRTTPWQKERLEEKDLAVAEFFQLI